MSGTPKLQIETEYVEKGKEEFVYEESKVRNYDVTGKHLQINRESVL